MSSYQAANERSVAHLHIGDRIQVLALEDATVGNRFEGRTGTIVRISTTYGIAYADLDAGPRGGKARKSEAFVPAQVRVLETPAIPHGSAISQAARPQDHASHNTDGNPITPGKRQ